MKHTLPAFFALLTLAAAPLAVAQTGEEAALANPPNGEELMTAAVRQMKKTPSLVAKIRQTSELFGYPLFGDGEYLQMQSEGDTLLKLQLKMTLNSQDTSVHQVCDGRFLWIRRRLPSGVSLGRVDLKRVEDAQAATSSPSVAPPDLALGGLAALLDGLGQHCDFGPARASQMGDVPVWVVQGRWKPEILARLAPEHSEDILAGKLPPPDALPAQAPDHVVLALGRDDRPALFPYRIEYRKRTVGEGGKIVSKPLVVIELYEVRQNVKLQRLQFEYEPGDQVVSDQTDMYLEKLGLKPAPPKAARRGESRLR